MFSDEIPSWAETAVTVLANAGVVEGNPDGTFGASSYLNRAEAAALLWRVLMMGDASEAVSAPFTDVGMGEWYSNDVAALQGLGLVEGNPDGSYQPAENINRAEFLKLAMNVYVYLMSTADMSAVSMTNSYVDLDTSAWYAQTVSAATEWGFVEGNSCEGGMCFDAGDMITRAEASQILYNMFGASL
jgi:hypothetical protein